MGDAKRRGVWWAGAIVIVVGAGAFATGRWSQRVSAVVDATPLPGRPVPAPGSTVTLRDGSSASALDANGLDAIRSTVREEVSAALAEAEAERGAGKPPAGDDPVPVTPESVAAVETARALVAAARAAHRWTRQDAASLRSAMVQMTAAQRDEILSTLILAVNRDEIRQDQPFLF